jgi:ABC-2 type transport system permease protein
MSTLVRFMLRRDRIVTPVCLVIAAGFVILTAASFQDLYPTAADRAHFAATIRGNATYEALYGPAIGLDTIGGLTAWRTGGSLAAVIGLINLLLVGRHTRAEEERGRTELIRAAAIGPRTPLAAALVTVAAFDLLVAATIGLGLTALGLPAGSSFLLGAALASVGLVFAAVAAVTAQVTESVRAANGLAGVVLGAAFVLRAAGDSGDGTLSWLSPIGWGRATHAFAGDRWWPLLLCVAAAAALIAAAFRLLARRDLGAGLLRSRPGPPRGDLDGELGLAFRLQRGGLIAWTAGLFLCGVVIGSVGTDAGDLVDTSQGVADVLTRSGGDVVDAFFASVFVLLALMGTGYTISSALRLRAEETAGHAELLLSTPVARLRWAAGHLLMAMAGSAAVMLATGLGAGLAYALGSHDASQIPRLTGAALAALPAVWVLGALVAALFGLAPRAVSLAWAVLGACVLIWLLGPLLDVPGWVLDLSPYQHISAVPSAAFDAGPVLALTAVAAALTAAGLAAFRRRDIT